MSKLINFLNTLSQDELKETYREMELLTDPLTYFSLGLCKRLEQE